MTRPADKSQIKPALEITGLTIRFGGLTAIERMTFAVNEGEIVSLIGPNGAGKTSAFNAITGYIRPAAGKIEFFGSSLVGLRPNDVAARGVVRTFQKTSVFGGQSVFANVQTGLHLRSRQSTIATLLGLRRVAADERMLAEEARATLDFVGLNHRRDELGSALPYGEQRLLEVAIALAARPVLLLLDEPVSGMNPSEKASFIATIARIRARKITILLVEHDMRTVMGVSDRVVVLNQGRIIADGPPGQVQRNPDVVRAYLGEKYAHAHR